MTSYSINDLEKLSGIKAHTIRIWEKRYSLLNPKRTETNIRYYDDADLRKVLNIALLNRNGIRISQIACLSESEVIEKINSLSELNRDDENIIDNLVISMIDLNERKFERILNNAIMQKGFEDTIMNTIYPLLEKIGILWQTGSINPAQEHFVSNLIRQKLIVAIDGLSEESNNRLYRFVLFLPEGEMHEIGLLFYHYLIKKRGHKVIYLGQSVPYEDLKRVVDIKSCDYFLTSFSSNITGIDIMKYLEKLSKSFPDQIILFSSFDKEIYRKKLPDNLVNIRNALEFNNLLDNL